MSGFDSEKYICKFAFETYGFGLLNQYKIRCDLRLKEIVFEFYDKRGKYLESVGYKLSDSSVNEMLPFVEWEHFEKYRDLPNGWNWDFNNGHCGYRDGWGYNFWCLSQNGYPLLQINMNCIFCKDKLPPYEKLLKFLEKKYKNKKELKSWYIIW